MKTLASVLWLASASSTATTSEDFETLLTQGDFQLAPMDAVARTWDQAPEVDDAEAAVDAARAQVARVRVGLYPRLDLGAQAERIGGFADGAIGFGASAVEIAIPRDRLSMSAGLSYPLTSILTETLPNLRSRKAALEGERHRLDAARQALAGAVLEAYWLYAQARGTVLVAKASLEQLRDQAERLRVMNRAGLSTPADRAAAEAQAESASQRLVQAKGTEVTARSALTLLLGISAMPVVALPAGTFVLPTPSARTEAEMLDTAQDRRPELRALLEVERSLRHQKAALWSQRLPRLDLQAEALYAHPNPNVIPPQAEFDPSWSAGAQLGWSPTDWATAQSEARRLDAELRGTEAERRTLLRSIHQEVRAQRAALETARQTWAAAESRLAAANEAYQARLAALENGRGIYSDVLEAEAELTSARLSKLEAVVDGRLAAAALERAMGTLGP